MWGLWVLGPRHERSVGTFSALWLAFVLTIVAGVLHSVLAIALDYITKLNEFGSSCSVGLSSYLFALIAIDSLEHRDARLLLAHLGGLAAGYAYHANLLNVITIPNTWISKAEAWPYISYITRSSIFVPNPFPLLPGYTSLSLTPSPVSIPRSLSNSALAAEPMQERSRGGHGLSIMTMATQASTIPFSGRGLTLTTPVSPTVTHIEHDCLTELDSNQN
eukprot:jgi/Hompol1/5619/HPOL_002013-RA